MQSVQLYQIIMNLNQRGAKRNSSCEYLINGQRQPKIQGSTGNRTRNLFNPNEESYHQTIEPSIKVNLPEKLPSTVPQFQSFFNPSNCNFHANIWSENALELVIKEMKDNALHENFLSNFDTFTAIVHIPWCGLQDVTFYVFFRIAAFLF